MWSAIPSSLLALPLAAATLLFGSPAAHAGLIILPEQIRPTFCRAWLVPPSHLNRAVGGFVSETSLALLPKGGLEEHADLALALVRELSAGALRVKLLEKPAKELALVIDQGRVVAIEVSVATATRLLDAAEQNIGRLLVTTDSPSNLDEPALAGELVEQLIALEATRHPERTAWDALEAADRARYAFKTGSAKDFRPDTLAMASALWPIVGKARETDDFTAVARAFGKPVSSGIVDASGFSRDIIAAYVAAGDFRVAFAELGLRASRIVAVQEALSLGKVRAGPSLPLQTELARSYDEIYLVLARKLETRILLIAPK